MNAYSEVPWAILTAAGPLLLKVPGKGALPDILVRSKRARGHFMSYQKASG